MDSSSKQCTNCFDILRTLFLRFKSSDNTNPSRFSVRIYWPVFLLGPCTLKLSVLLLCSGIISSGFCLYLTIFEEFSSEPTILDFPVHTLWLNVTNESVFCLKFYQSSPNNIFKSFFIYLEVWHHPLDVDVL